ncbi:MAG: hypothetical protein ABIP09_04625 [Gemmatimonadaceae bacterium]
MSRVPDLAKREAWERRLVEFERRGVTVAEFCARERVSVASFHQWRRKLASSSEKVSAANDARRAEPEIASGGVQFLPIEITGQSSVEVLLPSGAKILVPCHESEALRTVLATLWSGPREDRSC